MKIMMFDLFLYETGVHPTDCTDTLQVFGSQELGHLGSYA